MPRVPEKPTIGAQSPAGAEERSTRVRSVSPSFSPRFVSGSEIEVEERDHSGPVSSRRPAYAAGLIVADKYELLRPLAAGGMGEIWVAHHLSLDIDVAVKFIGDVGALETRFAERLLEEARNTARLGHPAIVRALDFGHTERGDPFIVLELLEGEDLATRLDRSGPLPAEQAVTLLLPVAHALSTVHDSGIVHRDIKPENVFLTSVELGVQAKLLDFGISRKTDRARRLTVRDTALGTPDYMSPEQARGETSGEHTDQWSFCVVLYEALTQRRPFEADNYNALLRSIIEDAPRALAASGLDEPDLWQILARGLAKAPSDRFTSIRELGEALALWLLARGVQEDSVGTSLRRVWIREPPSTMTVSGDGLEPVEVGSGPAVAALERASTQVQGPSALTSKDAPISVRIRVADRDAHRGIVEALEQALDAGPRARHSAPDLAALADLHRGGDPEDLFRREAQRRAVITVVSIACLAFGLALAILIGTGVFVW